MRPGKLVAHVRQHAYVLTEQESAVGCHAAERAAGRLQSQRARAPVQTETDAALREEHEQAQHVVDTSTVEENNNVDDFIERSKVNSKNNEKADGCI